MSILHIRGGRRFNIYAGGIIDGVRYANFTSPEVQSKLGISAIDTPAPPAEFDPLTWTRQEQDESPYVVYAEKPRAQALYERRDRLEAEIAQKEASTLLARPVRDVLLVLMETTAAQQGITPAQLEIVNPGYARVKQLDREIGAARDEIRTITAEIGEKKDLLP